MSATRHAARFCSITAALVAFVLVSLFHNHEGVLALLYGLVFSGITGSIAFILVNILTSRRIQRKKPVLGWFRGVVVGLLVFVITVAIHTLFFIGIGGFWVSAFPTLFIGLLMFGWLVAIVAAIAGVICERKYFA